ncbi:hypothetical protein TA3x_002056 [Tundrisphaera sp. TA3]|uniref:hypothetical protein n=1 Tax=Tundrisphaera sp. TA3 TaxID=3435775 RepID=UPI003EC006F0
MPSHDRTFLLILSIAVPLGLIATGSRRSRWLSTGPFVAGGEDFVLARSSRMARVLMLGSSSRFVLADRREKAILIRSRTFWCVRRSRRIPFGQVRQVLYDLTDLNPHTALGLCGDSVESFTVGLRLVDDEVVRLFRFVGDGTYRQGWDLPRWLAWATFLERLLDVSGTQEEDSKDFLGRLARLLQVEIARF